MTKSELIQRARKLREDLTEDVAEEKLEEIAAEITQIEEALDAISDEVVEVVEEAPAEEAPAEERDDEEPAEEEAAEEAEEEVEERKSTARRRAEMRSRLQSLTGRTVRKFNDMEGVKMSFTPDTKEYRNAWLSNLQGKTIGAQERTALANGNYVIPQETLNKVYGAMELYPLLNAIDVMHIPGTVEIPVEGTVNAANVVAMGTAATDSADSLAHVSLTNYKFIKTVEITADVMAMAIPAFENWLVDRLANKIYRLITGLVATGNGSSTVTGLTSITASSTTGGTYTKTGITYADLMAIIAHLPSEYLPNAKFVTSRQIFFGQILGMEDTVGQPVVVRDPQAPGKYNVLGFEVILEDSLNTTGSIVFGDLKEGYVFNFGKDLEVARDESVGFRTGSTVFRGMALGDGKPTGVGLVRFVPAP